jgi:hypothetical protein
LTGSLTRLIPLAFLVLLVGAAPADAKLISKGSGTSFAIASGKVKEPKRLSVSVDAKAPGSQAVEVSYSVRCKAEPSKFDFKGSEFDAFTPLSRRLPIPLKRPDRCHVQVSASQTDFSQPEFVISIELRAKRR